MRLHGCAIAPRSTTPTTRSARWSRTSASGGSSSIAGRSNTRTSSAIVEYMKTLPFIAPERIGYMGMSHGGEMAFKIASEYHGVRAMIACEPAAHEFLRLRARRHRAHQSRNRPARRRAHADAGAGEGACRGSPRRWRARGCAPITTPIFVQGRNTDELQGIFRVCYDLLVELGKEARWATYEHDVHGFVYVRRNEAGRLCARRGAAAGGRGFDRVLRRLSEGKPVSMAATFDYAPLFKPACRRRPRSGPVSPNTISSAATMMPIRCRSTG